MYTVPSLLYSCMCICYLSSRQLAEEVMKGGPPDNDEEAEEGGAPAAVQGFEGMEALAKAIELGRSLDLVQCTRGEVP